jgi:hypothetical protein
MRVSTTVKNKCLHSANDCHCKELFKKCPHKIFKKWDFGELKVGKRDPKKCDNNKTDSADILIAAGG